ncbi:hypothetical protein TpMuguga_01g00938 [Theileria parva strain Muguga]|uniref:Uncharacterized protein n=1 Tax=Theileria parva TaxID=5875 RepID=Q4N782_THEPA|nr:uncharacterized protein TpMuguga_01g00938 [Theileria parva strain Muguga]EAN34176.1 hypothetical protein TpMuguga_01g00938 [Theileria parva strain Muguga]|eukprot:XP_766459.1 hypothetical protein [Theileria parva strain Muguga]
MAGSRQQPRRIRCFSFRRRRNVFDYVNDPSRNHQPELTTPNCDTSLKSSKVSKDDEVKSDTTDDLEDSTFDKNKHERHNLPSSNYTPQKDKALSKKSSTKSKLNTPRSSIHDPTLSSKPSNDHVSNEADYLGYGMVDLPKDRRMSGSNNRGSFSKSSTFQSVGADESQDRDIFRSGRKFIIGGKQTDGKPSIERCIWELVEKRGWGMMNSSWSMMGPRVFNQVVEFLTGIEISLCRQVSKGWYKNVTDVMVSRSEVIVDAFKKTYRDMLTYDRSYILFQPVLTAIKAMRIDVIIRAKVEPQCTMHKNSFGYTYSYHSLTVSKDGTPNGNESGRSRDGKDVFGLFNRKSSKNKNLNTHGSQSGSKNATGGSSKKSIFINKFIFEVLKKNSSRSITFTRDLSSMHREDINLATTASISQVCEGDYIEVPITLINAIGATDVQSIKFLPLVKDIITNTPSQLDLLHREWYTVEPNSKYLEQLFPQNINSYSIIHPHKLLPQLVHQVTQVAGIDVITSKSSYVASNLGVVAESCNIIGHTVEVVAKNEPIICMIQRIGLQHDRICHVQLRPGDVLQFYLTKG